MSLTQALLQELDQEAATTRRVLERVPNDRLGWKPHQKSMSLGVLALHVASSPGEIAKWVEGDTFTFADGHEPPEAASASEVLSAHEASVKRARAIIEKLGDEGLQRMWAGRGPDGSTLMTMPKIALVRSLVMNHLYHHRGQLSVYLRLLDVAVPSIYGPSADESPLAAQA